MPYPYDQGSILDYPIAWNGGDAASYGLTLNNHRKTDGTQDTAVTDYYLVDRFDFPNVDFRDQRDGLHLAYGGDLGVVSGQFRLVSMGGSIVATSFASLEDMVGKLEAAFHPETRVLESAATRGVRVLDFYCPTASAPSGYSSPLHEKFSGRPTGLPAVIERRAGTLAVPWAAQIICPDTRRYMYAAESKACNSGNSWSIAVPNWTAKQGADTAGVITLVLTGTGSSNCTLRYVDPVTGLTTDLVLDLSGLSAAAHTIVVDLANQTIYEGSTYKENLRTSAVNTYWRISPGSGTFSVPSGRTALTSATLAYNQARA